MRYAMLMALLLSLAVPACGQALGGGAYITHSVGHYEDCEGCGERVKEANRRALIVPLVEKSGGVVRASIRVLLCPACAARVTYGGKPLKQPKAKAKTCNHPPRLVVTLGVSTDPHRQRYCIGCAKVLPPKAGGK